MRHTDGEIHTIYVKGKAQSDIVNVQLAALWHPGHSMDDLIHNAQYAREALPAVCAHHNRVDILALPLPFATSHTEQQWCNGQKPDFHHATAQACL